MRNAEESNPSRGFALRDVLIGSLLVGVVLVFAETTLRNSVGISRGAFCQSNMRQVGIALNMYAADYDGKLPMAAGAFAGLISSTRPYMRDDSRYLCPEKGKGPVGYRVPTLYAGRSIAGGWNDPYLKGQSAEPGRTILLFESETDRETGINPSYRHMGGTVCLLLSGQTSWEEDLRSRR